MKYKKTWLAMLAVVVIAAGVWAIFYTIFLPTTTVPRGEEHPSVTTQPLIPSTYDNDRSWFGPWQQTKPGSTGSPHLVVALADGAVDESSWTATVSSDWKPADPPQLGAISAGKKVQFQTNAPATYTVDYGQPFILQQIPDTVYAFVRHGTGYRILSIPSEQLHQLGNKR